MKAPNFFFSSFFVAATAWAETSDPLAFFAKVDENLVPLSSIPFNPNGYKFSALIHGDLSAPAIEFELQEKQYAITKNTSTPGYAGFYASGFVFGPEMPKTKMLLDAKKKVHYYELFSCPIPRKTYRMISFRTSNPECFKVDVFLLPYDRATNSVMKKPTPKKNKTSKKRRKTQKKTQKSSELTNKKGLVADLPKPWKELKPITSETPFVFFVQYRRTLIRLRGQAFWKFKPDVAFFSYGSSDNTIEEFRLEDNHACVSKGNPGCVGVFENGLGYGLSLSTERLILDTNMRVRNHDFYSCRNHINTDRIIATKKVHRFCVSVKIYVFPYDTKTGKILNSY